MDDSLITVREVADYLKLKEQTVYLLARQNKIPSLKVGGSLRFKKSQIDAWLASSSKNTSQEALKPRVLIVDDEENVRETLRRMVEVHGISAVCVDGGMKAVEAAQRETFKMIFLDLNMPEMNGVQTLKALKEIDREVVFVVVTALAGEDDLFRGVLESAPVAVIPKPFTKQQISDVLGICFEDIDRSAVSLTLVQKAGV